MNPIKKTSLFFRILFQILFIALPVFLILAWVQSAGTLNLATGLINLNYVPAPYWGHILHPLSSVEKYLALGAGCFPLCVSMYILYSLIHLFKWFEQGLIFSMRSVQAIRKIGYALIAGEIVELLYQFAMGVILTWHNPAGHRFFAIKLDQANFGVILAALMMILVSWIMREGCKLQEEQQLTV